MDFLLITMLIDFPSTRFNELIPLFAQNQFLFIHTKTLLKEGLGSVIVDEKAHPTIALLSYKVFDVVTGNHENKHVLELLGKIHENRLIIFPNKDWIKLAEEELVLSPYPRIKFSSKNLSIEHVNNLLKHELPEEFDLEKIDIETAYNFSPKLAPAFLPFFPSPEAFVNRGLGYCIKEGEKVVSAAAASMPIYDNEFEIQVITDDDKKYRRRGFATKVCAALIKESLEKGITPHWDADNEISAKLALKLGFTDPINYSAFICNQNPLKEIEE